MKQVLAESSC